MLQKCQECGKEYSSLAKSCPNCACPNLHYLEMKSAYRGQKEKKNAAAAEISESLFQMRLSLTLLIVTIALTVLMMQVGIAPANVESQSFIEFMFNPQDWISFYTSFFIVFYLAICILFCGRLIGGIFAFILLMISVSWLGSMLPQFLQGVTMIGFILFPLYLMFVRPLIMLIRAGYFKSKVMSLESSEPDLLMEHLQEMDQQS